MSVLLTTDDEPLTISLDNAIAVYVHKLLAERVKSHLLQEALEWRALTCCSASTTKGSAPKPTTATTTTSANSRKRHLASTSATSAYTILSSEQVTGVSKLRRGYHLLLLTGAETGYHEGDNDTTGAVSLVSLVSSIPPMARRNISWACRIQFQIKNVNVKQQSDHHLDTIGTTLWKSIVPHFATKHHSLRVDVHPRTETERICRSLQQAAAAEATSPDTASTNAADGDPFEGPIPMTMSATKCTHRMVVIITDEDIYWGTMDKSIPSDERLMLTRFNHQATEELLFQASKVCGADHTPNTDATIPLSRAYYKLDQVWHDIISQFTQVPLLSGLDLGASPGGWTQVLIHVAKLPQVVAVDPGRLADRVLNLSQVKFVNHSFDSTQGAIEIGTYGQQLQYSHVVCDASILLPVVFDKLVGGLLRAVPDSIFALPSCWVITIKLPFKTQQSLVRHMVWAKEWAPVRLNEIATLIYPSQNITIKYTFAHLMANSDSERTLIATMEEEKKVPVVPPDETD